MFKWGLTFYLSMANIAGQTGSLDQTYGKTVK